jgi:hypothetical protein
MNDEQRLEAWFSEREVAPKNVRAGVALVMTHVRKTRQQGRWLPLPLHRPKAPVPSATDTIEYPPSAIPATEGQIPIVIGRTHPMFSPAKAITAAALVFGIGGVMLIAQPFDQQGSAPGAPADAVAPTRVTGEIGWASSCTGPDTVVDGDVTHQWNYDCSPQTWTASDPRLSGQVVARWNNDAYLVDGRYIVVNTSLDIVTNDAGGWVCTSTGLYEGPVLGGEVALGDMATDCVGQGGYEGLSAVFVRSMPPGGSSEEFVGLIFSGDRPPLPEPPAAG